MFPRAIHLCFGLFCLLLGCSQVTTLLADAGTDVVLPCKYDAEYYGRLPSCWSGGALPYSGCGNELISHDGESVIKRMSERYLLLGDIGKGDVSLTIRQVREGDSGTYGCRVNIPGWFNDHKHEVTLTVNPVCPSRVKLELKEVKERAVTVRWLPGFDGGRPITSYRIELKDAQALWDRASRTSVSNPATTQVSLVDLRPGKRYVLRLFVINSVGASEASNELFIRTKEAAPEGPPVDVHVEALSARRLTVTWEPPAADLRNGILSIYSIHYREYNTASQQPGRWRHLNLGVSGVRQSVVLSGLKPSAKYGVKILAGTLAGQGPASREVTCSTLDEMVQTTTAASSNSSSPFTVWIKDITTSGPVDAVTEAWEISTALFSVRPDPPALRLKLVEGHTISLIWTAGFDGGSPITGYSLEYKAQNASWEYSKTVLDFGPNQTEATIIEINPSTYNIRMFAKSGRGDSRASEVLTVTTGERGRQSDGYPTTTSVNPHAAANTEGSQSVRLAAIVLPLVLLTATVVIVIAWQARRMMKRKGSLSAWLTDRALFYRVSEPATEL